MADMYGYQSAIQSMNQREQAIQESNDLKQANNLTATDDYNKQVAETDVMNDLNLGKDFAVQLFSGGAVKDAYDARNKRVAKEAKRLAKMRLGGIPEEPPKPGFISRGLSRVGDAITDAITNPTITPTGVGSAIGGGVSAPSAPTAIDDPNALDEMGNRIRPIPPPPPVSAPSRPVRVQAPQGLATEQAVENLQNRPPPPAPTATIAQVDEPEPAPEAVPDGRTSQARSSLARSSVSSAVSEAPSEAPSEPEPKEEPGLTQKIISGVMGTDEETSELIGRVGGAITSGAMGGLSIYDDVDNLVKSHGQHLFDKNATGADDYNNITSTIASVSDVVGLIPGAEWVAGLGNLIGESGNLVKLFGDHDKQAKNAPVKPLPETLTAPTTNTGQIANVGVQSAVKVGGLNTY